MHLGGFVYDLVVGLCILDIADQLGLEKGWK